jgi:hypothetical protein
MRTWIDRVTRRFGLLLGVALLAAAVVPLANGARPVRIELPPSQPFPIDGYCAFDVMVEPTSKQKAVVWNAGTPDERAIVTGTYKARLTNMDTGKTWDLNLSGPGTFTVTEDGFRGEHRGRWVFFIPQIGVFALTTGLVIHEFSESSGHTLVQRGGTWTDVCEALA